MKKFFVIVFFSLFALTLPAVHAQQDDPVAREKTRQRLATLLDSNPLPNVTFRQSEKQPFNYVGSLRAGQSNVDFFEIVISATPKNTIGFRVYPHYNKGYINVDKVKDRIGFMRLLLRLSDRAFLFWGVDESGDVFTGYTVTLESGFPDEAIKIVLLSIPNSDRFIGELRPFIDGSAAVPAK